VREITLYSPSPQPSPMKGEGVFLTFYESISFKTWKRFCIKRFKDYFGNDTRLIISGMLILKPIETS